MPTFEITAPDGATYNVDGPDEAGAVAALKKMTAAAKPQPQGFWANAADLAKSIPGGMLGGLSNALSTGGQAEQLQMGEPVDVPSPEATKQILQKNVTGPLATPQGRYGQIGESIGQAVGNPASYIGPGGLALKVGGAVLSGAGSEAGRQAAEGTPYETPASVAGALAGGAAAGKIAGPTMAKAAIPTAEELIAKGRGGYRAAASSELDLSSHGVSGVAATIERDLSGPEHSFTPGRAGETFDVLRQLQALPKDSVVSGANLETIRQTLGDIAAKVQPAKGGFTKATPDAAAATIALEHLNEYMASIPSSHVVAGDPAAYVRSINQARGDYGAGSRLRNVDARLTKAENAADRQVAGSLDSQIKSKVGAMLDNPQRMRGLNDAEKKQIELINSGGPISNTMRQIGRGGAGVIPLGAQVAAAVGTGGAFLPQQIGLAAMLYGARKGSEQITKHRANKLADMLAKRSPEYESRVAAAGAVPPDTSPQKAALIRALLAVH